MALKTAAEHFGARFAREKAVKAGYAIAFNLLACHGVILTEAKHLGSIFWNRPRGNKPEMFKSLASSFAFRCSAPVNMTTLCKGGIFTD